MNVGTGREVRIAELAETVANAVGYRGEIVWDASRPDGQPRRCLDISRARAGLDFEAATSLAEGLRNTVDWYLAYGRRDEVLQRQT